MIYLFKIVSAECERFFVREVIRKISIVIGYFNLHSKNLLHHQISSNLRRYLWRVIHLFADDLKEILDQSTLQVKLCNNPILVSVEELQKVVTKVTRDKGNLKVLPFAIPSVTQVQL